MHPNVALERILGEVTAIRRHLTGDQPEEPPRPRRRDLKLRHKGGGHYEIVTADGTVVDKARGRQNAEAKRREIVQVNGE